MYPVLLRLIRVSSMSVTTTVRSCASCAVAAHINGPTGRLEAGAAHRRLFTPSANALVSPQYNPTQSSAASTNRCRIFDATRWQEWSLLFCRIARPGSVPLFHSRFHLPLRLVAVREERGANLALRSGDVGRRSLSSPPSLLLGIGYYSYPKYMNYLLTT
eukprot:2597380-Pleurochrysis_carterae.AAC.4